MFNNNGKMMSAGGYSRGADSVSTKRVEDLVKESEVKQYNPPGSRRSGMPHRRGQSFNQGNYLDNLEQQ